MRMLKSFWFSLRSLLFRDRTDRDIDDELAYHLEREAAMYERDGMSRDEARREAIKQFGGIERYRDECKDVRRTSLLDDAVTDVRHALRLIRLHRGFSANVIIISALGIVACATTFSVVSGVLLSSLPFPHADRIASFEFAGPDGSISSAVPIEVYRHVASGSPVIEAIGASYPSSAGVDWNGEPESASVQYATPSFLRVFGTLPVVGRNFTPEEADTHAPVVLISNAAWHEHFRADPSVVGRHIGLDGVPHTIVGVLPPDFRAHMNREQTIWRPMDVRERGNGSVNAMVLLRPGVTRKAAESWLATFAHVRIMADNQRDSVSAIPTLPSISERIYGYTTKPLLVLFGAVMLVLVLVAANVATMFLARSSARTQELQVRRALGASGGRQVRQLITEATTLTAIGGVIGILISYWTVSAVRGMGNLVIPRMESVALDWRVIGFSLAATVFTGAVGGLAPALTTRRASSNLRSASDGRVTGRRTSTALIVVQITLSVVLLVGAGLLLKSFLRIAPSDPGFAVENRAMLYVELSGKSWFPDTGRFAGRQLTHDVAERMKRVTGVVDVGVTSFVPLTGSISTREVDLPGKPKPNAPLRAVQNVISPNYFDVMQMKVLRGRSFNATDVEGRERVAIVNETAVHRWWPNENPIGQQVAIHDRETFNATVVGVVNDARLVGQDTKVRAELFLPIEQSNPRYISWVAKTNVDPRLIAHDLRKALWSVAPQMPVETDNSLAAIAEKSVRRTRFFSSAMTFFAVASVTLCALAVYGLLAFAVVQRRREIGIRLALGASPGRVGGMIVRNALVLGALGVGFGLLLARWLSKYMESVLIEVSAKDGTVFAATAVVMLLVGVIAACVPALQAVRIDPVRSLREG
jgi:putative ABC transport system permease protein